MTQKPALFIKSTLWTAQLSLAPAVPFPVGVFFNNKLSLLLILPCLMLRHKTLELRVIIRLSHPPISELSVTKTEYWEKSKFMRCSRCISGIRRILRLRAKKETSPSLCGGFWPKLWKTVLQSTPPKILIPCTSHHYYFWCIGEVGSFCSTEISGARGLYLEMLESVTLASLLPYHPVTLTKKPAGIPGKLG